MLCDRVSTLAEDVPPSDDPARLVPLPGVAVGLAVVHVDGTAFIQTVDQDEPLVADSLRAFERRTGVPVLVNTSSNTTGRPKVDTRLHALECFGSCPIDLLVMGPFVLRRTRG